MQPRTPQLIAPLPSGGVFSGPPYAPLPRSYKGLKHALFVIIVIGIVGGAGFAVYHLYLSPSARAYAAADAYVKALTTDDADLASYLSSDGTAPSALETAAAGVKGNYSMLTHTRQDGAYYYLYGLTNPTNKFARAIVIKTDTGYRISSFLYSSDALALVPGQPVYAAATAKSSSGGLAALSKLFKSSSPSGSSSSTAASTSNKERAQPTVAAQSTATSQSVASSGSAPSGGKGSVVSGVNSGTVAACLAQSDYANIFSDADPTVTYGAKTPYTAEIDFTSGSTAYTDDIEIGDLLNTWGTLYKTYPKNNYTIHLQPSASSTYASLVSPRVAKVTAGLTGDGVSQSVLITDSPSHNTTTDDDPNANYSPYVILSVIPGTGC